jgi:hypothetical protein
MSVALRGNLKDFGIADVFQLIGQQRKTGILEFSGPEERVRLIFDRGAIVSAFPVGSRPHAALGEMLVRCGLLTRERVDHLHRECEASARALPRLAVARGWMREGEIDAIEDLLTRETIFSILCWSSGSFDFRAEEVEHDRELNRLLGAEQILMDGLRMVDEWQSFAEFVPSEDLIFRRVGHFEDYRQRASGEARRQPEAAERLFFMIDGRLPVRRIIDLSLLGTFDATRILADLRRARVIEPLDATGVRHLRRRQRPAVLRRPQVQGWLAALFPLTLLLLTANLTNREVPDAAGDGAFSIRSAPLETARATHTSRRVRRALEVFRFADGRWPRDLAELEERGILAANALAPAGGRPYYYIHREDGALLLAPER